MKPQDKKVWITGTTRSEDGEISVLVQDPTGARRRDSLENVVSNVGAAHGRRRQTLIPLQTLLRSDTQKYLDAVGLGHLENAEVRTYEVQTDLGLLVIPAQLLVLSILASQGPMRKLLLSPKDPAQLMPTFITGNDVEILQPLFRKRGMNHAYSLISTRIQWLQTYPSARIAWGSVYRNALDGVFDMTLPKATVRASMTALLVDGKYYVTRLWVSELIPEEEPFSFAAAVKQQSFIFNAIMILHPQRVHLTAKATTRDERLTNKESSVVTDAQWHQIEPILHSGNQVCPRREHDLRTVLNVILYKLSTGCAWRNLPESSSSGATHHQYYRWKASGQWDQAMQILV
jgi:hypothetical protein